MTKIADVQYLAQSGSKLRTMPVLVLTALLAACTQQGDGTDANVMMTVQKESCEMTTVFDRWGNVKIIRNWVLHNETMEIPAASLSDYRSILDQERESCNSE